MNAELKKYLNYFFMLTGIFLLMGLFYSLMVYVGSGYSLISWKYLKYAILWWLPWCVFFPLMIYIIKRFPLKSSNWYISIICSISIFIVINVIQSIEHLLYFGDDFNFHIKVFLGKAFQNIIIYVILLCLFYLMDFYKKSRESELNLYKMKEQLSHAKLEALKMQLHPHFLFNTLNTATAMMKDDHEKAEEVLSKLSDLLRMSLENTDRQEITLKEELEFLDIYLDIQKIRFQEKFEVIINVDESQYNLLVPNLILQPIVENAIRHGISKKLDGGKIEISIKEINGKLNICVSDNGIGIKEDFENLLKKGMGISNTVERLNQLYGKNYNFNIENLSDGVCVSIEIPYNPAKS